MNHITLMKLQKAILLFIEFLIFDAKKYRSVKAEIRFNESRLRESSLYT